MPKPVEFIEKIEISTFQGETIHLGWGNNLSNPSFKIVDFVFDPVSFEKNHPKITSCYELVLPKPLPTYGIQNIDIEARYGHAYDGSHGYHFIKMSPPGYFHQNSDVQRRDFVLKNQESFDLLYQIDNFLKIGDEDCNPDPSYNRDECVIQQLLKVKKYQFDNFSIIIQRST